MRLGKVVKSFFHPYEGKAWEVSVPDETMKGALRCFDRMEMEIGGMDLLEGEDGYYALEVNDFPGGIKLIGNWSQIITDLVVKTVQRNQEKRSYLPPWWRKPGGSLLRFARLPLEESRRGGKDEGLNNCCWKRR